MAIAKVNGLSLAYETVGDAGSPGPSQPAAASPRSHPGCGNSPTPWPSGATSVLIWDRPNCGASDVCFDGPSGVGHAGRCAGWAAGRTSTWCRPSFPGDRAVPTCRCSPPAVIARAAAGLAIWWISGGVYGLLSLATHYCGGRRRGLDRGHGGGGGAARVGRGAGTQRLEPPAVPGRRTAPTFIAAMERWMLAYCPRDDERVPGLGRRDARGPRHPGAGLPEHGATACTQRPPRRRSRISCRWHDWSSRPGETANGSSVARPATADSSPAGPCWRRTLGVAGRSPALSVLGTVSGTRRSRPR